MNSEQAPAFRPLPPRIHPVTYWHRVLGIVSTLIVLITIITGLVLNHADALKLSEQRLRNAVIRYLYGHQDPEIRGAYQTPRGWVTQIQARIFLDGAEILRHEALLIGAYAAQSSLVIAFTDRIVELDHSLGVVEQYGALDGLALPFQKIGIYEGAPFILTNTGLVRFEPASGEFKTAAANAAPEWQTSAALSGPMRDQLIMEYGGPGVTYERLLVDLHSGRLFGLAGVIIVDAAALCVLLLAVSGIYMYFKFKRKPLPPPPP